MQSHNQLLCLMSKLYFSSFPNNFMSLKPIFSKLKKWLKLLYVKSRYPPCPNVISCCNEKFERFVTSFRALWEKFTVQKYHCLVQTMFVTSIFVILLNNISKWKILPAICKKNFGSNLVILLKETSTLRRCFIPWNMSAIKDCILFPANSNVSSIDKRNIYRISVIWLNDKSM